ncbi:AI-2E family transporter [Nocardioides bruguierae]|uniref:AI-2E family transporter n=1 Tax=Nocardioides bruguierae TaxID=2945102 RepID=UPI0020203F91|nr:AI-2E family transporter [Nocardioides bruguierae]MCL8026571.1 AI-2E family transporter [Nocardioides bruguierae]
MSGGTSGGGGPAPAPEWLVRWGLRGWLALGALGLVAVLMSISATLSGVVVPLAVAILLGALLVPVVDALERVRVPRAWGAVLVLVALVGVVAWSLWLTITGVAEKGPEIADALTSGTAVAQDWVGSLGGGDGTSPAELDEATRQLLGGLAGLVPGLVGSVFSSAAAFVIGLVVGGFFFYYVLVDWSALVAWAGRLVSSQRVPGAVVIEEAVGAVRAYFGGVTLSALVTVVLIGGTALVLGVDLWITIAVVTFVTSYVPYLGAIVSGAFATVVALGTEGPTAAIVMLVVILVVQNVVQTVVMTKLTSEALHIHPIVNLASTLVGGALAGILGATLSAPAVATALRIRALLDSAGADSQDGGGQDDGDPTDGFPPPSQ